LKIWSGKRDSNPRRSAWEADVLQRKPVLTTA
jgi:hypothetical protein